MSDDMGHLIEASVMLIVFVPLALLTGVWWVPAAFITVWFHAREKTDAEVAYCKATKTSRLEAPIMLWFGKYWSHDNRLDFALPTLYAWAVTGIISMVT